MRRRGWVGPDLARRLHNLNFILIGPVITCLGTWLLDRSQPAWWRVPLALGILFAISSALGVAMVRRMGLPRERAGTFALLVPLSNTGHLLAGFLTLLLLGEAAYPYNAIGLLPYAVFFVILWLPLARHWGHGGDSFWKTAALALRSPQASMMIGLVVGAVLNYSEAPMARGWVVLLKWLVYGGTAMVMFALGTRLRLRRTTGFMPLLRRLFAVKFIVHPILMVAICWLLGIAGPAAGALLIIGFMPVGTYAVALATVYDLDVDLANAGYLWTTLVFMACVLPFVVLLLKMPVFQ
jgi:hypothetical protein